MSDDVYDDQEEQTDPDGQKGMRRSDPAGTEDPVWILRTWCRKKVCHAAMNECNLSTFSHPAEVFFKKNREPIICSFLFLNIYGIRIINNNIIIIS